MTLPSISVIVASRHRPRELLRCIEALRQQDHPRLELIIVADPAAAAAVRALALPVKLESFDAANLSAARNAGLAVAAGDVTAFIDDDAVAEPTWASRLAMPFADLAVMQATGFVRGRNGLTFQWRAMEVDARGRDHALSVPARCSLHRGTAVRAVKTQGTNCAFRRAALLAVGGFDPAYRFYLDDADLNLRLAARGGLTAVVPDAQVQHGFSASALRRADRAPLQLFDIGASSAVFLRRHAPGEIGTGLQSLVTAQRERLLRLMVAGAIEPRDVARLCADLDAGIAAGRDRTLRDDAALADSAAVFLPLTGTGARAGVFAAGWVWERRTLRRVAQEARRAGCIVTVLIMTPGRRPHRQHFLDNGIWWQQGGVSGTSDRSGRWRPWRFAPRAAREAARIALCRPV